MTSRHPSALCAVAATLLAASSWAMAQTAATPAISAPVAAPTATPAVVAPTHPAWADDPMVITSRTTVNRVIPGKPDIILMRGGLSQGFRDGVLCVIQRSTNEGKLDIAEVIVVATQPEQCAGLIVGPDDAIYQKNPIQPNDQVRLELH